MDFDMKSFFTGLRTALILGRDFAVGIISKFINRNGVYRAADDHAEGYDVVTVDVPNSYTAADEGKVVSSGALVAQTARTITQNGTYDTTYNNSVDVALQPSYRGQDILAGIWKNGTKTISNKQGLTVTADSNECKVTVSGTRTGSSAIDVVIMNIPAMALGTLSGCVAVMTVTGTGCSGGFWIHDSTAGQNVMFKTTAGEATIATIPTGHTGFVGYQFYGNTGNQCDFTVTTKVYGL